MRRVTPLLCSAALLLALALSPAPTHGATGAPVPPESQWLRPPPVLQVPSRGGAEGPPRPLGILPATGAAPRPSRASWAPIQSRQLLHGPFPDRQPAGLSPTRICSSLVHATR